MALNFRIIVHQSDDNLHLRLEGDFDSTAAQELLNALETRCRFASRAFIHTNGLTHIDPFGSCMFRIHLDGLKGSKKCWPLDFTGDHAEKLAPEGSLLH
jgi:hypothetical protein